MAKKNILIKTNYGGAWDELYPITAAGNVKTTDGSDVEAQLMGNRTIDQALTSPSNTGTITKLFSWIAGRIKGITGKNNWYDTPATTIEELNTNRISKTMVTAANDFIVGSASATVAKKTLAETKTILGVNAATEAVTGVVELATAAETTAGTDSTRAVHPAGLKVELDKKVDATDINGWKIYNSPAELGIAVGTETMEAICVAMPDKSQMIFQKNTFNAATAYPGTAGTLFIKKISINRSELRFFAGGSNGLIYEWVSSYDTNITPNFTGWIKRWNATNDGTGSGLDADTLDGVQLSALLQIALGGSITGNLKLSGLHALNINNWGDISAGTDGLFLIGQNCYKNASNNKYYYSNTHASLGASGILFQYGASIGGVYYFNTGAVATTADVEFTPTLIKIIDNTGRIIARNGTDYTIPQARNSIISTADPSGGANGDIWIKYKP